MHLTVISTENYIKKKSISTKYKMKDCNSILLISNITVATVLKVVNKF